MKKPSYSLSFSLALAFLFFGLTLTSSAASFPWTVNPQVVNFSSTAVVNDAVANATCYYGNAHCGAPFALLVCSDNNCSSTSTLYTFEWPQNNFFGNNQPLDFPLNLSLNAGTYYFELVKQDVNDWSFNGNGTITYNSSTPAIVLEYPADGSTTPDFTNWVVQSTNANYGTMEVDYGLSSSSLNYQDKVSFDPFVNVNPLPITKSQKLWYVPLSVPVTWYAEAINFGSSTALFSPIISFQVDPTAPPPASSTIVNLAAPFSSGASSTYALFPTYASSTSCDFTSSSFFGDPIGNVKTAICQAAFFLVLPSPTQQQDLSNGFNSLGSVITSKPPLSYFTQVTSALNSLQPNSNTTSSIETSSTQYVFSTVTNPLDEGIAGILWLIFGLWVFHRIRLFDFQA